MTTVLVATRNAHKVEEIQAFLAREVVCCGLGEWWDQVPTVVEDENTFEGNAGKKARVVAGWLKRSPSVFARLTRNGPLGVLADDSGLEVDALGGAPGVHSARFAALDPELSGPNSPDHANNAKLLRLLATVPARARTARFRCVLAWLPLAADASVSEPFYFQGRCEGRIAEQPSGTSGFGYDPLFVPVGEELSFAQLGADRKNEISHRARALAEFRIQLNRAREAR